ncbi:hypothetical protein PQR75_25850 [Paraburkholderia fungorum]|uniref:hypothetical protein n=1 Tax=Paraburkholderia fungorum TaxID=134537 RepID=UPI0038B95CFD
MKTPWHPPLLYLYPGMAHIATEADRHAPDSISTCGYASPVSLSTGSVGVHAAQK